MGSRLKIDFRNDLRIFVDYRRRTLPEVQGKHRKAVSCIHLVIQLRVHRKGHRVLVSAVIKMECHRNHPVRHVLLNILYGICKIRTVCASHRSELHPEHLLRVCLRLRRAAGLVAFVISVVHVFAYLEVDGIVDHSLSTFISQREEHDPARTSRHDVRMFAHLLDLHLLSGRQAEGIGRLGEEIAGNQGHHIVIYFEPAFIVRCALIVSEDCDSEVICSCHRRLDRSLDRHLAVLDDGFGLDSCSCRSGCKLILHQALYVVHRPLSGTFRKRIYGIRITVVGCSEPAQKQSGHVHVRIVPDREVVTVMEGHHYAVVLGIFVDIVQCLRHIRTVLAPCTCQLVDKDVLVEYLITGTVLGAYRDAVLAVYALVHCADRICAVSNACKEVRSVR